LAEEDEVNGPDAARDTGISACADRRKRGSGSSVPASGSQMGGRNYLASYLGHESGPEMKSIREFSGVYLHRDPVDGRKAINGLSEIVESAQMGDLTGANLFVFCGRRRDVIKILYFDQTGFALWQKRLEREKFPWPKKHEDGIVRLTPEQMEWLLSGYDVWKMKPFENFSFSQVS
jgi:transposase